MMKKRMISTILALIMIPGMMISCTNTQGNEDVSTTDSSNSHQPADTTSTVQTDASGNIVSGELDANGYLKDSLPADLNYGGKDVTILAWVAKAMRNSRSMRGPAKLSTTHFTAATGSRRSPWRQTQHRKNQGRQLGLRSIYYSAPRRRHGRRREFLQLRYDCRL